MAAQLRFLLMQIRNPGDPMREQEVGAFARTLHCDPSQVSPCDVLTAIPSDDQLASYDMTMVGGSGDYSATSREEWIEPILDLFRRLHEKNKPTFASCWGFQAMARAMGGSVVHDMSRSELGTLEVSLTDAGHSDPIFSPLGSSFDAQMGHVNRVDRLPGDAILLASTNRVENQAYRFVDKPIYCTQFHPELNQKNFLERLVQYPEYVAKIAGISYQEFCETVHDTPSTEFLLRRFIDEVFG